MTLNRLQQVAEAYGADPRRWPAAERQALEPLLAQHPAAHALLRGEQNLDRLLDGWQVAPPDWALERRIVAVAAMAGQVRPVRPWQRLAGWLELLWPGNGLPRGRLLWPQVAGLAAAAMIGFLVGISDFGAFDQADATGLDDALTGISAVGNWQ